MAAVHNLQGTEGRWLVSITWVLIKGMRGLFVLYASGDQVTGKQRDELELPETLATENELQ